MHKGVGDGPPATVLIKTDKKNDLRNCFRTLWPLNQMQEIKEIAEERGFFSRRVGRIFFFFESFQCCHFIFPSCGWVEEGVCCHINQVGRVSGNYLTLELGPWLMPDSWDGEFGSSCSLRHWEGPLRSQECQHLSWDLEKTGCLHRWWKVVGERPPCTFWVGKTRYASVFSLNHMREVWKRRPGWHCIGFCPIRSPAAMRHSVPTRYRCPTTGK